MLQPKRSTWDSYVPSKSKTKVVMRRMSMRMMVVMMVVVVVVGPLHALQGGIWGP